VRGRPSEQGRSTLRGEDGTRGELVRRGDEHGAGSDRAQALDTQSTLVDRNRNQLQPQGPHGGAVHRVAWVLNDDPRDPSRAKGVTHESQPLSEASAEDHVAGVRGSAPRTVEIGRQRRAETRDSARVRVSERRARGSGEHAA
jgi:hypothetical protein